MLSTDQKGAIAETAIVYAALRVGLKVYKPVAEGGRYDLIFEADGRLLRVQCKWASRQDDVVIVRAYSSRRTRSGMLVRGYTEREVDGVAAYCPETERCYFMPIEVVGSRKQIFLRLGETRNGQRAGLNWAAPFEFAAIDWSRLGAVAQLEEHPAGSRKAGGSSPPSSTSVAVSTDGDATIMGSHEFRNRFGHHLERAAAGERLLITRHGKPLAELGPPVGAG